MFWRFGGYAQISAIDTILEKADFTLEELLDESDLIQELKSHNTKLIDYLRQDEILEKLLEYVVAPKLEPVADEEYDVNAGDEEKGKKRDSFVSGMSDDEEEDDKERKRNRYAYVAAEILASDSWSLTESLLANQTLLRKFWEFLSHQPPLDPLQAGYFTKVNEALLDKKTEEMLDLFKSIPHVMEHMLQHVDSPMVMDLLLKIISLEKAEGGQGIVDWLHSQNLIPTLLSFLSEGHSWATQTSAGDFLKAIITISANASQNEQSCIGPNELTRQLVSRPCVERLINDMLKGGNPLTVGVGIVIEVIRKNNSDYDPEVSPDSDQAPSSRDPIYLGTLLRLFADHVPDFMALILSDDHKVAGADGPSTVKRKEITAAFGGKVEPLGFDRFKTCELMAELLHCSNMGLLNERGAEEFVAARDAERERLKAQGKLAVSTERFALDVDDLTMNSGLAGQRDSESPDQQRLSEDTQTISEDDDGFEEITRSQGFTDEEKSDTNTNKDMDDELLDSVKTENYQSFLDKVDDDFVDEPLSSPRLNTDNEPSHAAVDADLGGLASPTREVTAQVEQLNVDTSPPSYDEHTQDTPVTVADDSAKSIDAAEKDVTSGEASSSQPKASEAPPLAPTPDAVISGRPEDTPAPLFADRKESADTQDSAAGVPLPDEGTPGNDSTEMQDSTMVDADGTIQIENGDESMANEEVVVGDYLKRQFVTHSVVPTILDFFFRFPWNNFLHNVVYDVVQQVFNGPMDRGFNVHLAVDLFWAGKITIKIVEGQARSDKAQEEHRMRLGYMGHLTLIAEEVVKFTERHPPELLSDTVLEYVMAPEWVNYVEVTLCETRERDNAILGGVKPESQRQAQLNSVASLGGGSSALADAGLNGGGSNLEGMDLNGSSTSNSFTLSGNSLLSGFGSSSDEEDEELDEDMNDDDRGGSGAELSRFLSNALTATSTTTGSGLDGAVDIEPPSFAPPPPPVPAPLNIQPSRARRQLAARLALHNQKQLQGDSNGDVTGGADDDSAADHSDRSKGSGNMNPFADTDSEDEDDWPTDFQTAPSGSQDTFDHQPVRDLALGDTSMTEQGGPARERALQGFDEVRLPKSPDTVVFLPFSFANQDKDDGGSDEALSQDEEVDEDFAPLQRVSSSGLSPTVDGVFVYPETNSPRGQSTVLGNHYSGSSGAFVDHSMHYGSPFGDPLAFLDEEQRYQDRPRPVSRDGSPKKDAQGRRVSVGPDLLDFMTKYSENQDISPVAPADADHGLPQQEQGGEEQNSRIPNTTGVSGSFDAQEEPSAFTSKADNNLDMEAAEGVQNDDPPPATTSRINVFPVLSWPFGLSGAFRSRSPVKRSPLSTPTPETEGHEGRKRSHNREISIDTTERFTNDYVPQSSDEESIDADEELEEIKVHGLNLVTKADEQEGSRRQNVTKAETRTSLDEEEDEEALGEKTVVVGLGGEGMEGVAEGEAKKA